MSRSNEHPRRLVALVALVTACLLMVAPAGAATSAMQQLRDAAVGTWSGAFGTLEFGIGETVTFTIRVCGYIPVKPGFVTVGADCAPDVVSGRLRVGAGRYVVAAGDGGRYRFGAYVEGDVLHVGPGGGVARLDEDRTGTIDLGAGSRLVVGEGRCRYVSASDDLAAKCVFVERDGRTILDYRWPDPFEGGDVTRAGLVYLAHGRLLVSPELVEYTFTRQEA